MKVVSIGSIAENSFPKGLAKRAMKSIELAHADVCRPMRVVSLNNNLLFVAFIDDFSRLTWVYFAKEKSVVFSIFKIKWE